VKRGHRYKRKNVPHHAEMIKEDETITFVKKMFFSLLKLFLAFSYSFQARIAILVE